jgi:Skp family chaperone for outer membrane proteins
MSESINPLDQRVTILETEFKGMAKNLEKIEVKMDNNYATLHHRVSELRDDLHEAIEDKHEKLIGKLDEQNKNSTEQHKAIAEKISSLEQWRWLLTGAAVVVGYVLAHIKVSNLF